MSEPGEEVVPSAVWEGTISMSGVTLHCYVLEDGMRIIDAEDMARLLAAWADGAKVDPAEAEAFARWQRAMDPLE